MAYGLPSRGQADWDDELNNSIEALRGTAERAEADATVARSTAVAASAKVDGYVAPTAEQVVYAIENESSVQNSVDARIDAKVDPVSAVANAAQVAADLETDVASKIGTAGALDSALSASTEEQAVTRSTRPKHAPALGLYFPEAEGAAGDGTTDDTAALNAAIAAAATGGGMVMLAPNTTYAVTTINSGNRVTLQGCGWQSVLKLRSTITDGVLTLGSHDGFTVRDLKVDGNRANVSGTTFGILKPTTAATTNLRIENVWVTGTGYIGIALLGPSDRSVLSENVTIRGCLTTDTGGHGIIAQNGIDNCIIDSCTVETFGVTESNTPGITVGRNSYSTKVINCTVDGAGALGSSAHGISIDTTLDASVCANNIVRNTVGMGIEIGYCAGTTVTGNTVSDGAIGGIVITATASDTAPNALLGEGQGTPVNMTITGNVVRRCGGAGIGTLVGSTQSDSATPAWKVWGQDRAYSLNDRIVHGRRLYEATTAGTTSATVPATLGTTARTATVADGTVVWTDRGPIINGIAITGNVCEDNGQVGIELMYAYNFTVTGNAVSRNGRSGIYIPSNCNLGMVEGNTLSGNCVTDVTGAHANIRVLRLAGARHRVKIGPNNITAHNPSYAVIATEGSNNITGRFQAGDTTPSVAFGDTFFTANTGATTITNFDDPMADGLGRIIAVRIADANTTLQHSAGSLDLSGDVNYSPPTGTHMLFAYTGGVWREVSRSAT